MTNELNGSVQYIDGLKCTRERMTWFENGLKMYKGGRIKDCDRKVFGPKVSNQNPEIGREAMWYHWIKEK